MLKKKTEFSNNLADHVQNAHTPNNRIIVVSIWQNSTAFAIGLISNFGRTVA